jgi:hypothetical protein
MQAIKKGTFSIAIILVFFISFIGTTRVVDAGTTKIYNCYVYNNWKNCEQAEWLYDDHAKLEFYYDNFVYGQSYPTSTYVENTTADAVVYEGNPTYLYSWYQDNNGTTYWNAWKGDRVTSTKKYYYGYKTLYGIETDSNLQILEDDQQTCLAADANCTKWNIWTVLTRS